MRSILFLLIFGVTGFAVLMALGSWQARRLVWKQDILAEIETRIADQPIPLPAALDPRRDRFLPVVVSGTMLDGEIPVLVSVKRVGPGYRIIAPFETDDGRHILIDRGFVPTEAKGKVRALGPMRIIGNLHWPQEIDDFTPDPDRAANIWFARDVPMLAAELGTDPILIIAKSQNDPGITPLPVDTAGIPNDHLQYAVTWFGLALVWVVMTLYFLWRSRARKTSKTT